MAALERLRQRLSEAMRASGTPGTADTPVPLADRSEDDALRARLTADPNDVPAFDRLAQLVGYRAALGHEGGDPQREADDAVWALAEEIAHSPRAWYPLVELARLSIDDDREVALRRLATAADRDHTGYGLAQGLAMLRDSGHPAEALNLGVGHWRPADHVVEAGRELVLAAIEAGRPGEAQRHLDALDAHPDQEEVARLRHDLLQNIEQGDKGSRSVDVREDRAGLLGFLRR